MSAGVKRMPSVMSTLMVRVALAATPGWPMAASASPWPCPPAWLPVAEAPAAATAQSAAKAALRRMLCFMVFLWKVGWKKEKEGTNRKNSVAGVATTGLADLHFDVLRGHVPRRHRGRAGVALARGLGRGAVELVGHGALGVLEPAGVAVVA